MKETKRGISLSLKMNLLLMILISITFTVIIILINIQVKNGVFEIQKQNVEQSAVTLTDNIDNIIMGIKNVVFINSITYFTITENLIDEQYSESITMTKNIFKETDYYHSVLLLDRRGRVVAANSEDLIGKNYAGSEAWKSCISENKGRHIDSIATQSPTTGNVLVGIAA